MELPDVVGGREISGGWMRLWWWENASEWLLRSDDAAASGWIEKLKVEWGC